MAGVGRRGPQMTQMTQIAPSTGGVSTGVRGYLAFWGRIACPQGLLMRSRRAGNASSSPHNPNRHVEAEPTRTRRHRRNLRGWFCVICGGGCQNQRLAANSRSADGAERKQRLRRLFPCAEELRFIAGLLGVLGGTACPADLRSWTQEARACRLFTPQPDPLVVAGPTLKRRLRRTLHVLFCVICGCGFIASVSG